VVFLLEMQRWGTIEFQTVGGRMDHACKLERLEMDRSHWKAWCKERQSFFLVIDIIQRKNTSVSERAIGTSQAN
jgi:hypothetical protein